MAEIFQSKYTAEEIEQIFDHVNDKNPQIEANTQDIARLKELIQDRNIIDIVWVSELPTEDISTKTIYMLKDESSTEESNVYAEYAYNEETGWECIGSVNTSVVLETCTDEEIIEMVNGIWGE